MLALSRRKGESIKIGENIFIHIVNIGDGRVRLGIDAPKEIPVFRTELLEKDLKDGKTS